MPDASRRAARVLLPLACVFAGVAPEGVSGQAPAAAKDDTLTLERAVAIALDRNPEVRRAAAAVDGAAAERRTAWGAFLPSVHADASFSRFDFRTHTFPAPDGSSVRLDEPLEDVRKGSSQGLWLRWELPGGGQRFVSLRETSAAARAASARLGATERQVRAAVERAYFEALARQAVAGVAERQLEERRQDLEVARRRYEIAAVDRTDVLGAEIELGTAELALLESRDAAEAARRDLYVQMGLEPEAAPGVTLREPPPAPPAEAAEALEVGPLVDGALATEPELVALGAEAEAAAAGQWTARSRYLPDLALSLGLSRSETLGPEGRFFVFDPSNRTTAFSLSAQWTLFDGFRREGEVAAASVRERTARAERARRALVLEAEVRDLVREIQTRARRLAVMERRVELAQRRLEMTRERYRLGAVDYVELLTAAGQLTDAERGLIQERYDYRKAWAGLEERVGNVF